MKVKASRFNFFIPFSDGYLIYNTFNGALAFIDAELKNLEASDFQKLPPNLLKSLLDQGFLIEEFVDELLMYEYYFNLARYLTSSVGFLLLTTYDCNFNCVYCYERPVISKVYMDLDVARRTATHITKFTDGKMAKHVEITLYGGEPLLNLNIAQVVLDEVLKWCQKNGVSLDINLVTNGSLITPEVVNSLKAYNLNSVQVTMDGPKEIHDKRRPFRNGMGSFDVIMSNVLNCIDSLPITIRVNVDKGNVSYFPAFLDLLDDLGLKNKAGLWIAMLHGLDDYCKTMKFNDKEANEIRYNMWRLALKRGFKFGWYPSRFHLCDAMRDNAQIIDPKGNIYKCWSFVGLEECTVGKIGEGTYKPYFYELLTRNPIRDAKCSRCNVLPYCNGGCLYEAYCHTGNRSNFVCGVLQGKEALESMLTLHVISMYKEKLVKSEVSVGNEIYD
ncbi:MAG: SPASM domain-containing protein [Candidatus Brockarchaeota archaeon]|nr:SPASM domain-containing protein [Candidatus Brockarchaeota archaeon]